MGSRHSHGHVAPLKRPTTTGSSLGRHLVLAGERLDAARVKRVGAIEEPGQRVTRHRRGQRGRWDYTVAQLPRGASDDHLV